MFEMWHETQNSGRNEDWQKATRLERALGRVFGDDSLRMTRKKDGTTLLVSIDGQQYAIEELGGGLSRLTPSLMNPKLDCIRSCNDQL
jgi:hypothetical protein